MKELEKLNVDVDFLIKQIKQLEVGKKKELKKIYGERWSKIKYPTKVGKKFKQLVINNKFTNLKFDNTRSDNHAAYEKVN